MEEWHVYSITGLLGVFDSFDDANTWIAMQLQSGAISQGSVIAIRRVITRDHVIYGFPTSPPYPTVSQNVPTFTSESQRITKYRRS